MCVKKVLDLGSTLTPYNLLAQRIIELIYFALHGWYSRLLKMQVFGLVRVKCLNDFSPKTEKFTIGIIAGAFGFT
jgi:hypothetical protein